MSSLDTSTDSLPYILSERTSKALISPPRYNCSPKKFPNKAYHQTYGIVCLAFENQERVHKSANNNFRIPFLFTKAKKTNEFNLEIIDPHAVQSQKMEIPKLISKHSEKKSTIIPHHNNHQLKGLKTSKKTKDETSSKENQRQVLLPSEKEWFFLEGVKKETLSKASPFRNDPLCESSEKNFSQQNTTKSFSNCDLSNLLPLDYQSIKENKESSYIFSSVTSNSKKGHEQFVLQTQINHNRGIPRFNNSSIADFSDAKGQFQQWGDQNKTIYFKEVRQLSFKEDSKDSQNYLVEKKVSPKKEEDSDLDLNQSIYYSQNSLDSSPIIDEKEVWDSIIMESTNTSFLSCISSEDKQTETQL